MFAPKSSRLRYGLGCFFVERRERTNDSFANHCVIYTMLDLASLNIVFTRSLWRRWCPPDALLWSGWASSRCHAL